MRAGDVLVIDFGFPRGSEAGLIRPAIVIAADALLQAMPATINVIPVTSNRSRRRPTEVALDDEAFELLSVAQCHLCTAVSREAVLEHTGRNVGPAIVEQLRSVLADIFDIG